MGDARVGGVLKIAEQSWKITFIEETGNDALESFQMPLQKNWVIIPCSQYANINLNPSPKSNPNPNPDQRSIFHVLALMD